MNNKPLTFEEDLIRQAGDCPFPAGGLRSRVIAAAEQAATRRLRIRRSIAAVVLVLWFAGSIVWGRPSIQSAVEAHKRAARIVAGDGTPEVFATQSNSAMRGLGEWAHVEWFVHLRQLQSQILRGTY